MMYTQTYVQTQSVFQVKTVRPKEAMLMSAEIDQIDQNNHPFR
jgi:hypothetical protein